MLLAVYLIARVLWLVLCGVMLAAGAAVALVWAFAAVLCIVVVAVLEALGLTIRSRAAQ